MNPFITTLFKMKVFTNCLVCVYISAGVRTQKPHKLYII